jgi:hypothetical protein
MEWARILAYISGTVDQELLLRDESLAAENRILKAQFAAPHKRLLQSAFSISIMRPARSPRTRRVPS